MIAALFVEATGSYSAVQGVDVWDVDRDARKYRGPHPVVAHPPCKRWGRYWHGSPSNPHQFHRGDDSGCYAAALWSARTFGGVVEHPEGSAAVAWFGLPRPATFGWGWSNHQDPFGGRSCLVSQGRYGHRAQKKTWLYAVLPTFPALDWRTCPGAVPVEHLAKPERFATPAPFRDLLLGMVAE